MLIKLQTRLLLLLKVWHQWSRESILHLALIHLSIYKACLVFCVRVYFWHVARINASDSVIIFFQLPLISLELAAPNQQGVLSFYRKNSG